jgi:hypothetical protein
VENQPLTKQERIGCIKMDNMTGTVREYVGARYVPLFADPIQWDNTKEYEPLTIVLYNGNSFTSRQFVPVGIDINNDDFWAETGNYNAQIEQYRQEVLGFDNRIKNNTSDIDKLSSKIDNKIIDIDKLSSKIDNEISDRDKSDKELDNKISAIPIISLEQLGGTKDDPSFDNAAIINDYFTEENQFTKILYIPEGEWYIQTTLNLSYCEVISNGIICCGDNFEGSTYITDDGKNPVPAVIIGYGIESSYTFDNDYFTFLKNRTWNLSIDCKLKPGVSGLVVHRTWSCFVNAFIRNALEYGLFTGRYITESVINANIGIFGQHGTEIVGNTGVVSRSADYILDNIVTMHYLKGVEFFTANTTLNYWHGYGYYDAAHDGVGLKFSQIGNITINTVFNDGCPRCFDFTPGNFRRIVSVVNYNEIGRTGTNQLYLISNFDASWNWLTINNLEIPFISDESIIKAFVCRYLVEKVNQHHQGTILNHFKINNFNLKRRIVFLNASDPNWEYFDAWKLPLCSTPFISIDGGNASFTKEVLESKHMYGIIDNPGLIEVSTMDNTTSFSTSDSGYSLRFRGLNCIVENSVRSQGGEGSTANIVNVAKIGATFSTVNA